MPHSSALICINLRTAVKRTVMLSATKHLGPGVRSFAECTLSGTNVLRMTHQEVTYSGSCIVGTCWHLPALPTTLSLDRLETTLARLLLRSHPICKDCARLALRAQASRKEMRPNPAPHHPAST